MSNQQFDINMVINTAKKVLTNPVDFYRSMSVSGGLLNPLIFVAVMAFVAAVILTILAIVNLGDLARSFSIASLIVLPIFTVAFSFIGAAVLFVIWKLMGSTHNFEVAYRCVAYSFAIMPVMAVLSIVPYIDGIVQTLWFSYLMYIASIEVHQRKASSAKIVFGVLAALFVIFSLQAEYASRQVSDKMSDIIKQADLGALQGMSSEELQENASQLLKQLEETQRQQQQQLQ